MVSALGPLIMKKPPWAVIGVLYIFFERNEEGSFTRETRLGGDNSAALLRC